jgi:chromate transport protein ChrA
MTHPSLTRLFAAIKSSRNALLPSGDAISEVAVIDMLVHNWHLGLTSFGGPAVHFQLFQQLFIDKYKWIEPTTYQEMFALCQALSGPGSTKMIFAINVLRYGFWTGLVSFFLWSLPMAIAAFGLALGVRDIGDQLPGPVYALLSGLNSATVGIIALAAVQLSQKAVTDKLTLILVFLGATAGMLYNSLWYFPVLMVAGGVVTITWDLKVLQKLRKSMRSDHSGRDVEAPRTEESTEMSCPQPSSDISGLHSRAAVRPLAETRSSSQEPHEAQHDSQEQHPQGPRLPRSWKIGATIIASFLISFIIVMSCRGAFTGENRGFDLFANLYLAGTIIFGGGPVVIPLLREYIVAPGWVSPRDFLLGLAITQAFPGPNFNFAVYLGALAVQGTSLPSVVGALIGYIAIFTPGLWLHTGFMGLWSTVRGIHAVKAGLRGIHATAVGLVFTAVYRLFEIGYLDSEVQDGGSLGRDPWWVVIIATTYVGGMHFKVPPPLAIVLGAVMGLVWYGVVRA